MAYIVVETSYFPLIMKLIVFLKGKKFAGLDTKTTMITAKHEIVIA